MSVELAKQWYDAKIAYKEVDRQISILQTQKTTHERSLMNIRAQLARCVGSNLTMKVYKIPNTPEVVLVEYKGGGATPDAHIEILTFEEETK